MRRRPTLVLPFVSLPLLALATGCDKDPAPAAAASVAPPPPPPPASSSPASPKSLHFAIDPASRTTIDMPAPKERIKAETTAAKGDLTVDPSDLSKTRGQVKVDLTTLATHTFDDPTKDKAQTEHSHNWLEAGDLVTPGVKAVNQWVIFTIRDVTDASSPSLAAAPLTNGTPDDKRVVSVVARGDFFLHGHTVPKEVPLEVTFDYPAGYAAKDSPTSIEIRTKTPLHVVLADHDVKPRDGLGKLAQGAFNLLGTKVAETADVTFDLRATPAP
jgi:hypothetical protein